MTHLVTTLREPLLGTTLFLVILCILPSSHGEHETRECSKLYVDGTRNQPQVSGHYELLKSTYNNRLVYRHVCSQYYLFYNISGYHGNWLLANGVGSDVTSHIKSHDTRSYPRQVTSWWGMSRENGIWAEDENILVTCIDDYVHRHCRSVVFRGDDVPRSYIGPYALDGFHGNHVKYKHVDGGLYVFHHDDGSCKRWIVGPKPGKGIVSMQALSNSSSPFEIRERWMIAESGHLSQEIHSVQLTCQENDDLPDSCGQRLKEQQISPYMYSAKPTFSGKWPFMVSYTRHDGIHKCGATLIGHRWVITAGHCVSGSYLNRAQTQSESLRLGAYDLGQEEDDVITVKIKTIHIHPLFTWILNPFRLNYDVALIELTDDVTYTDKVQPSCLMAQGEAFPMTNPINRGDILVENYTNCHIVGWGQTSRGGVGGRLQEVSIIRVMDLPQCHDMGFYAHLGPVVKQFTSVCLFGDGGGRMCKGDSGSPLLCEKNGRWTLLGLGGWSRNYCIDYFYPFPSVYTDLSIFRDWIVAIMYGSD